MSNLHDREDSVNEIKKILSGPGEDDAARLTLRKGDEPGHPFRGNQYTGGEGGAEPGLIAHRPTRSEREASTVGVPGQKAGGGEVSKDKKADLDSLVRLAVSEGWSEKRFMFELKGRLPNKAEYEYAVNALTGEEPKSSKKIDSPGEARSIFKSIHASGGHDLMAPQQPLSKGDVEGHEFHGNQYTGGEGGGKDGGGKDKEADAGDIHDWASEFAQKKGSALDVWMSTEQKETLKRIVDKGGKVSTRVFSISHFGGRNNYDSKLKSYIASMKEKDYRLFADENNIDQGEAVFVRDAVKKEDDPDAARALFKSVHVAGGRDLMKKD